MNPSQTATHPPVSPILGRGLLFVFSLPGVLQGFMNAPAGALLQGLYAKHAGIALITLGTAVLVVRIADALSDVLIGLLVDRSVARGGSRKPWIAAGTVVTVVALWYLMRPPVPASAFYFGFWFLVANIGWSLTEIPYRSWSLELSRDYVQRARIQSWIAIAGVVGGVLFFVVPNLAKAMGQVDTIEYNLENLAFTAIVAAVITPLLNLVALLRVPDAVDPLPVTAPAAAGTTAVAQKESAAALWRSVVDNAPLLRLLLCFALITFLGGLQTGVSFLYFDSYLGLGSQIGVVMALAFPATALSIPFWGRMSGRYPRERVWALSTAVAGLGFILLGLLPPKAPVALVATAVVMIFSCISSSMVIAPAILGDIVDYALLRFGRDRSGLYTSLYTQVLKSVSILAGGIGMIALGWMGFDATKTAADMSADALLTLKLICAWIPAFGVLVTVPLMWTFPIKRADQERIVAELRRRAGGTSASAASG